jgi:hypothetical protein
MRDVRAGIAAGCMPVLLTGNSKKNDAGENRESVRQFTNLLEFVESCL